MRTRVLSTQLGCAMQLLALAACGGSSSTSDPITWTSSGPVPSIPDGSAGSSPAPIAATGSGAGLAADTAPTLEVVSTDYVGQITGSPTNPFDGLGLIGTDLGISYQRDDRLYFLFGDSWTTSGKKSGPNKDADSIAWTSIDVPDGVPQLNWVRRGQDQTTGEFLPLRVERQPAINFGPGSVPVEGVPVGDDTYIFFHIRYSDTSYSSVLAHAVNNDFAHLKFDHEAKDSKLRSVSTLTIGNELWIYGAGKYRQSPVYLARADLGTLADRTTWYYYNGPNSYVLGENNAKPLQLVGSDSEKCVGELSVRKHPTRELYFMAYNCDNTLNADRPHHIRVRASRHPEGPWSEPLTILDVGAGDHTFVHKAPRSGETDDGLGEPTREGDGDMYGPYMIPAWFSDPAPGEVEIAYTLSSWNPYQVQLLRTRLRVSDLE